MVYVSYGADSENADLAGQSVRDARNLFSDVFNIPANSIALVNGQQVDDDHELKDEDKLTFEKDVRKFQSAA